jgi:hypothetical protein
MQPDKQEQKENRRQQLMQERKSKGCKMYKYTHKSRSKYNPVEEDLKHKVK